MDATGDFASRLARAVLTDPDARTEVFAPAMLEPAMARRMDEVAHRVRTALGELAAVVPQDEGIAVLCGRTRFGMFYSRDDAGRANGVELYPMDRPRPAGLPRGAFVRWTLLAVPVYLAAGVVLAPTVPVRATVTVTVLAAVAAQWTNHRWDLTGVRIRPWWAVLAVAVPLLGWLAAGRLGTADFDHVEVPVAALTIAAALPTLLAARRSTAPAVSAQPPMRTGGGAPCRGYVLQGGRSRWLNHHHPDPAQRWAIDVVPVSGPLLRNPLRNPLRDGSSVDVLAPVDGIVARCVDRYPDRPGPDEAVPPYGNHVVIGDGDVEVFVCHLARGSVAVATGQRVAAGELLGRVGNSGRSTEPHLHLHATRDGAGVPIAFAGGSPWRGTMLATIRSARGRSTRAAAAPGGGAPDR